MNNWRHFDEKYGLPIGKGAQCQVYREGETVYKVLSVGHDICAAMREGFALATAEKADIPVSNIHGVYTECGHIVMEMDYVSGETLTDLIIKAAERNDGKAIDGYLNEFVKLQVKLHGAKVGGLGSARQSYASMISDGNLNVPQNLRSGLMRLIEGLPDGQSLCHNDFHPLNVISDGGKYIVIDWDSAMIGDPAGDAAHTYLVSLMMDKPLGAVYGDYSGKYLRKYLELSAMKRERVEAWLPLHAAILYNALIKSAPENAALMVPFIESLT